MKEEHDKNDERLKEIACTAARTVVAAKTEAAMRVNVRVMKLLCDKGVLGPDDISRFINDTEIDAGILSTIHPESSKELEKLVEYLRHSLPYARERLRWSSPILIFDDCPCGSFFALFQPALYSQAVEILSVWGVVVDGLCRHGTVHFPEGVHLGVFGDDLEAPGAVRQHELVGSEIPHDSASLLCQFPKIGRDSRKGGRP